MSGSSSFCPRYTNCILILYFRDMVESVGIIPKQLPLTTSNTIVHTFRHVFYFYSFSGSLANPDINTVWYPRTAGTPVVDS